jgi:hypothetical protein
MYRRVAGCARRQGNLIEQKSGGAAGSVNSESPILVLSDLGRSGFDSIKQGTQAGIWRGPALINEMGIPEGYHSPRSDIDAHPADLIALGGDSGRVDDCGSVLAVEHGVFQGQATTRDVQPNAGWKAASRRRAADDRPLFVASNLGKLLCRWVYEAGPSLAATARSAGVPVTMDPSAPPRRPVS